MNTHKALQVAINTLQLEVNHNQSYPTEKLDELYEAISTLTKLQDAIN